MNSCNVHTIFYSKLKVTIKEYHKEKIIGLMFFKETWWMQWMLQEGASTTQKLANICGCHGDT